MSWNDPRLAGRPQGCGGVYQDNTFSGNGRGSVLVDMMADVTLKGLCLANDLDLLPDVA